MKTETPQILWHNGKDNEQNKNAPIFSISLLESGIVAPNQFGLVLATAGNHEVNLWKLQLSPEGKELYSKLDRNTPLKMVKVDLLTTLTRHDATVNAVQFSPNGLHLATASDSGSIIIYSIPPSKRGGGNGQHYWSSVEGEQQLSLKILSGHDGIYDLDWSFDSRRLVVGTLDHCMAIYEDENYATNAMTVELQKDSQWTCMYRNSRDHSHYIQGVAMDPQGTYVASMSCDRTVRVYSKKQNKKKKVASDKLELGKGKLLKYYTPKEETAETTEKSKRFPLFAEEAASESFFRRLAWTADGAYLVTPAALWKDQSATLMFRRHCYDAPCKVLPGHDKPSRVISANPVLFQLPEGVDKHAGLTYKSIFAVLTEKSILIYDTYHTKPIAMARGLHYSGLTDAMWSPNGHSLVVSSSDGYLSFLTFGEGELGKVYTKKVVVEEIKVVVEEIKVVVGEAVATTTVESSADSASSHPIPPPKEQTINVLQPKKKSDKKRAELQQVTHVLQPKKKNRDSTTEKKLVAQPTTDNSTTSEHSNVLQLEKKNGDMDSTTEKKLVAQPTTGNSTTSKHSNVLQREKKNGDTDSSTEKKLVAQPTTDSITVQKGVEPQKINILQPKKKRKRAELTLVPAGTQ